MEDHEPVMLRPPAPRNPNRCDLEMDEKCIGVGNEQREPRQKHAQGGTQANTQNRKAQLLHPQKPLYNPPASVRAPDEPV
jgi:hypothetical protein